MVLDTAKITAKGQVTIPKGVRERFGLRVGTRIQFEETPEGELRVRAAESGVSLVEAWTALQASVSADAAKLGMTEEEADELIERVRDDLYHDRQSTDGGDPLARESEAGRG